MKRFTHVLGFNGSHDGSVAILRNGEILATVSKERHTRKKKDGNGNEEWLIGSLLRQCEIGWHDIDAIAFCDNYVDIENSFIKPLDAQNKLSPRSNIYGYPGHVRVEEYEELSAEINGRQIPAFHVNHHLGHCAYSFYTSPFEKSICLSLDGSPADHCLLAEGDGLQLLPVRKPDLNVSLLYDAFTFWLLGNPLHKAGSLMALASYGKLAPNFDYQDYLERDFECYWRRLSPREPKRATGAQQLESFDLDVACAAQYIFEKAILDFLNNIPHPVLQKFDFRLSLAGGSFLNCKLNGQLTSKTSFRDIHVSPACGDDGLAVGAALYVTHHLLKIPRMSHSKASLMYSGRGYDQSLDAGLEYDPQFVAREITKGKVVGFFQGRSEFGPRALGNRSLLADPRQESMRQYLNQNIKMREWFRPYGASVLKHRSHEFFGDNIDSSFMLMATQCQKPQVIPAVVHIDGSSRFQTVDENTNGQLFELINEFYKLTGVPLLLNTSLNDETEPIVETVANAEALMKRKPIYYMVMNNRLIGRS